MEVKVIWPFLPHQWVAQNSKISPNFPHTILQILVVGTFTLLINFLLGVVTLRYRVYSWRCELITETPNARSRFTAVTMGQG